MHDDVEAILKAAECMFGDTEKARSWLEAPLLYLDGQRQTDLAVTAEGTALIRNVLARNAWGAAC